MTVTLPEGWDEELLNVSGGMRQHRRVMAAGERTPRPAYQPKTTKLTESDVMWIRWGAWKSLKQLAIELDVNTRTIYEIQQYMSWKHVP